MENAWIDEVLLPAANLTGYRVIYEVETWLRRICLAAFILSEGSSWATTLNPKLRERLEEQSERNRQRWYLGVDAEEELLWSTTHGQLSDLLELEVIAAAVKRLCDVDGRELSRRLRAIAAVRNTLAHNRPISQDTITVLTGDAAVVRAATQRFKHSILYAQYKIVMSQIPDGLDELAAAFEKYSAAKPNQQFFLACNEDFVFVTRLPVDPFGTWPQAGAIRNALGLGRHMIVCVLANKQGDEIQIVFPRSLPADDAAEVTRRFIRAVSDPRSWTKDPPERQHPADVGWPRFWFYENQSPTTGSMFTPLA